MVLQPPTSLPEGTNVSIEVLPTEAPESSLFERLGDLVGKAVNLPPDASAQHDHYFYGAPKSS